MARRLTQIALALAAWHTEHQSYPQSLSELSPKYLAGVPDDLFSDKPLIYVAQGKGYRLSSVGPNLVSDPSAPTQPMEELVEAAIKAPDDLVVQVP